MIFSSIPFLYYFLPCVLLACYLMPKAGRNGVLLLFSLLFYAWGEPRYLVVMLAATVLGYGFGLAMERFPKAKKGLLIASVASSLSFLLCFKYADFFLENLGALTGRPIALLKLSLPVGISFYTFQILSYTIDVYRGQAAAQKNLIDLACYVTFFPQLIAGPIVRYTDIARQLRCRDYSLAQFREGTRRFLIGLGKKVLLANLLGEICAAWRQTTDASVLFAWLYAVSFTLHIYFDFSGYSDMAIGLGRLFGFRFPENFQYPYISRSITEFWRRWHISLGTWFRDYVYIPLGGNRKGKPRQFLNIFIVWMLTGFWHGAAWNFLFWGLWFAVLLIIEKTFLLRHLEKSWILGRVYVLLAVTFSFVLFDASSLSEALVCIRQLLGLGGLPLSSPQAVYLLRSNALLLIAAMVGATPAPKIAAQVIARRWPRVSSLLEPVMLVLLLLLCTAFLVDGSYNPFLYFRF